MKKRIFYLDVLRVIACLAVLMIHTSAKYLSYNPNSYDFWIGNIFDSLSRIGVPLFIMISGSLMLDEKYNCTKEKLKTHIFKMIIFFISWSLIYSFAHQIINISKNSTSISYNIIQVLKGHTHLWFVYLIVGLYLIVPILRLWVKKVNKKIVQYFIILSIILTLIIPQIIEIGSYYNETFEIFKDIYNNSLCIKYTGGYTIYFILGWYINNYEIQNSKLLYILGIIGFIITLFGTYLLTVSTGKAIQMYDNLSINIFLQSTSIFLLIKTKLKDCNKNNLFITKIANNTLGIYALHMIFISLIDIILILIRILQNIILILMI